MSERFINLKKIPAEPAARMLAMANMKLETRLSSPALALIDVVLTELSEKEARIDILRLLAVALPPREATWWACLAARDLIGEDPPIVPPPLAAAERWVFKPTEENRIVVRDAFETADMEDDTSFCAMAALYADGTLGPGDMDNTPAPPNGVAAAVLAMNMIAARPRADRFQSYLDLLIDRALDIARGGSGRVAAGEGEKVKVKG
ncbi:MAG: DUF6931 family protein [Pseudorhodobacter sp.]